MKRQSKLLVCLTALILCSCGSEQNFAEKYMLDRSNIANESSYKQYTSISNELNENGEYDKLPESDEAIPASGMVREKPICATLTQNSKLNIQYFSEDGSEIVPQENRKGEREKYLEHYLSPGESIYAKIEDSEGSYKFDRFRVIEDIENRSETSEKWWSVKDSDYVITVPSDFTGTDIIIEPLGVYHFRTLTLSDYIDIDGLKQNTEGKWTINDDEYENGKVDLLPDISYTVKYEYDKDLYYTSNDDCKPAPYHINEDNGIVEFPADSGEYSAYFVRLHPFTDISILNDKSISSVLYNKESVDISGNNIDINKLRAGDIISIDINDPTNKVKGISDYIKTGKGYRFTYTVPQAVKTENNKYSFNVEKWDNKKVSISVQEQNSNSFNIIGTIADLVTSESIEDSAIVIEVSGLKDQTYLYKDIKSGKNITINEPDVIKVKVNKNVLVAGNITITANDSESYEVNAQSEKNEFSFRYSDIDSLKITINETI